MAQANIHIPDEMRRITLKVRITGRRRSALRVWLGCKIITLASVIMGTGLEIDHAANDKATEE